MDVFAENMLYNIILERDRKKNEERKQQRKKYKKKDSKDSRKKAASRLMTREDLFCVSFSEK